MFVGRHVAEKRGLLLHKLIRFGVRLDQVVGEHLNFERLRRDLRGLQLHKILRGLNLVVANLDAQSRQFGTWLAKLVLFHIYILLCLLLF